MTVLPQPDDNALRDALLLRLKPWINGNGNVMIRATDLLAMVLPALAAARKEALDETREAAARALYATHPFSPSGPDPMPAVKWENLHPNRRAAIFADVDVVLAALASVPAPTNQQGNWCHDTHGTENDGSYAQPHWHPVVRATTPLTDAARTVPTNTKELTDENNHRS